MNRLVIFAVLGLAVAVAGCAQGRSAIPNEDGRYQPVSMQPVPSLDQAINADLPEGGNSARMLANRPDPALGTAAETVIEPVGLEPLPSLAQSINVGLPQGRGPVRMQSNREEAVAAVGEQDSAVRLSAGDGPVELPALPAGSQLLEAPIVSSPAQVVVQPVSAPAVLSQTPAAAQPVEARREPVTQPARNAVQAALLPPDAPGDDKLIGLTIAIVGGEPITLRQLQSAVKEWREENVPEGRNLGRDELNMVATELLEHLIDRTLLVQEAKRKLLSDDKKLHAFEEFAGARFKEDELPKLLRKYKVATERELSDLLDQKGLTLYDMKQKYLHEALSQEYLRETLKSQLNRPELDAMWAYYQAHLDEFQQSAQVKWREIVVRIDEAPGQREAARRKAEALLGQVRQGQDFAALAQSQSEGPTAAKGGYWETEPNASAIPAVNSALVSLPMGQVSGLLEGPKSFHIVWVEGRRQAGAIPFVEAQDKVLSQLQTSKFRAATLEYLAKLRENSVVITRFDRESMDQGNAPRDPAAAPVSGPGR